MHGATIKITWKTCFDTNYRLTCFDTNYRLAVPENLSGNWFYFCIQKAFTKRRIDLCIGNNIFIRKRNIIFNPERE